MNYKDDFKRCNICNELYLNCLIAVNAKSSLCWNCFQDLKQFIRRANAEIK